MICPQARVRFSSQVQGDYLMHFGIKGQRWGIRRFQNEDRSLTEEGKRRYGVGLGHQKQSSTDDPSVFAVRTEAEREKEAKRLESIMEKAVREQEKATNALYEASQTRYMSREDDGNYEKAYLLFDKANKDVKDLKILQKINNQKHISQHRLNLEQKYLEKGMSPEQAKIAAYKRDRTEKIIAISAVTTMAVAGAWLYKNHMADVDKIIPKDTLLQNLSTDPNKGVSDAFYATYDPADNRKYERLFGGGHLQGMANNPLARLMGLADKVDVQKMSAQAMSEMKIAGANVGRETANELIKSDKFYRDSIQAMLQSHGVGNNKNLGLLMEMNGMPGYMNVQDAVYGGKTLNKNGFNFINRMLVDHGHAGQAASDKLFTALRKKGYDGVIDLNDVFNSGYDAKAPVVIFNGGKKLGNITRATIDPDTVQVGKAFEEGKIVAKRIANIVVPGYAGLKGAEKAGAIYRSRYAERKVILEYKKQHPNTRMNDEQILKSVLKRS